MSMDNPGATLRVWLHNLPAAFKGAFPQPRRSPEAATTSIEERRRPHLDDGSAFFNAESGVWQRFPNVARYNPPAPTLPLPFQYYGQPFYKGFAWETKEVYCRTEFIFQGVQRGHNPFMYAAPSSSSVRVDAGKFDLKLLSTTDME